MDLKLSPGRPYPLGASRLPDGSWNFAIFSQHASAIDLCLFDENDPGRDLTRIRLPEQSGSVWHVAVQGLSGGQHYGYRVHGPWDPAAGHRFNPYKLLIDPYAKALSGRLQSHPSMCNPSNEGADKRDTASHVPKSVLVENDFDWGDEERPDIDPTERVIFETHVAGFTKRFPKLPKKIRGTYAGLAHKNVIDYIKGLGVTTVQLMPVHHHIDDGFLLDRDLTNYWGYQTLGFFAPESRYASTNTLRGEHVNEFKAMVKQMHKAGLEVILDVVYNHTGEESPMGPTTCFRGVDNHSYYRHEPRDPSRYRDFTGCGNTLDMRHPYVLRFVLDSMRYWVEEMHVDGFRFDLAATLGRESDGFFRESAFFKAVNQDPVLNRTLLIAEPWDLGPGGYQVGGFPEGWMELNGKFRDTMRRFWLGEYGMLPDFASRLTGSEDHYAASRRRPQASVNFITSHDGFTLYDLVSYNGKHNEANGENNNDGDSNNHSFNHGVEGPTDDPEVLSNRDKHRRNLIATMFISQGTPFILAGDERGRTQQGNNNAYCQDNQLSWVDWSTNARQEKFLKFFRQMAQFRRKHPELRRREFFHGQVIDSKGTRDVVWMGFNTDEHRTEDWFIDAPGQLLALIDGKVLLIINANPEPALAGLPEGSWRHVIDTTLPEGFVSGKAVVTGSLVIAGASVQVFESIS